jgi:hypothetical protein
MADVVGGVQFGADHSSLDGSFWDRAQGERQRVGSDFYRSTPLESRSYNQGPLTEVGKLLFGVACQTECCRNRAEDASVFHMAAKLF